MKYFLLILLLVSTPAIAMIGCPTESKTIYVECTFEGNPAVALETIITEGVEQLKAMGYKKIELVAYAIDFEHGQAFAIVKGLVEVEAKKWNSFTKDVLIASKLAGVEFSNISFGVFAAKSSSAPK